MRQVEIEAWEAHRQDTMASLIRQRENEKRDIFEAND